MTLDCLPEGLVLTTRSASLRLVVMIGSALRHHIRCDGELLQPGRPLPCSANGRGLLGTALSAGARYRDDVTGIEMLCLVPAGHELTLDGRAMHEVTGQPRSSARTSTPPR
jgi:hypothetical protein